MTEIATFPTMIATDGLAARLVDAVRAAWVRRRDRLAYADLLARGDDTLRDIGLARGDVRQALIGLSRAG